MGRKPLGKTAMSSSERQRRFLARLVDKARNTAPDAEATALREQLAAARAQIKELEALSLSKSAQEKLEVAKRVMERKLEAEYGAILKARMHTLDEEVRQRVLAEGKEYRATLEEMEAKLYKDQKWYRMLINDHKPPFKPDEYKSILMCLHPDGERTPAKLNAAFVLFSNKREILTGEREKKRVKSR